MEGREGRGGLNIERTLHPSPPPDPLTKKRWGADRTSGLHPKIEGDAALDQKPS